MAQQLGTNQAEECSRRPQVSRHGSWDQQKQPNHGCGNGHGKSNASVEPGESVVGVLPH